MLWFQSHLEKKYFASSYGMLLYAAAAAVGSLPGPLLDVVHDAGDVGSGDQVMNHQVHQVRFS